MRYFATLNDDKVVGLVRFDPEHVMTSRFRKDTQQWVEDLEDIDIVLFKDNDNREVDEAEANRIIKMLAPQSAPPIT